MSVTNNNAPSYIPTGQQSSVESCLEHIMNPPPTGAMLGEGDACVVPWHAA